MKTIHFRIDYRTKWGQLVQVVYSVDGGRTAELTLQCHGESQWLGSVPIADEARHLRHAYRIVDEQGKTVRVEADSWRLFYFNHRSEVCFCDAWADEPLPYLYHRTAFAQNVMLPTAAEAQRMEQLSAPCLLLLHATPPTEGRQWAVVGSTPAWGSWQIERARPLQRTGTYEWALPVTRSDFEQGVTYKYVLLDPTAPDRSVWEKGGDRTLSAPGSPVRSSLVKQDEAPRIALPAWRGAGVVIPVFSLRSEGSMGVGDFGDLRLFVRWAADAGMRAVQLLPINDTTRSGSWRDSYPYNGISVFALHPIYIDVREWRHSRAYAEAQAEGARLNALPELDYEAAFALKMRFLRRLYEENGTAVLKSDGYARFVASCSCWLDGYARFCALRDRFHTANFRQWPDAASLPQFERDALRREERFYKYVQYLLHRQMELVHQTARELGVLLKGDIPIGVCPDSASAWLQSRLFHFNGQAGAPPDAFAVRGQNWGFPTYNWDEMAKDGYLWWRQRLAHMSRYFDAYRIDHVLGFFRIWEVPSVQIDGVLGHFRPALPLTVSEIEAFGFTGDVAVLTRPLVTAAHVAELKATYGEQEVAPFFEPCEGGFTLRAPFGSQRAIVRAGVNNAALRRALLDAVTEVIFVADPDQPDHYHPRVSAQLTARFAALPEAQREAFNRLHDNFFYVRHNEFWATEAMKKLPVITQSVDAERPAVCLCPLDGAGMLPCAEDLGMVPASVKGVLERLNILSLEIQRMPKEYGVRFGNPAHNPYMSVATIATHDMPPLRLWWNENREQTEAFWHEALGHPGEAPDSATPEVCEEVVRRHVGSPSMLCLLALQDWLAISPTLRAADPANEQINVPANPDQYWRYRMHLTIEHLIRSTGFSEKLRGLIASCQG